MDLLELAKKPQWWQSARDRVKEAIEGPDADIDRIIKAVLQNDLKISAELEHDFPALQDRQLAARVRNAVASKRIGR